MINLTNGSQIYLNLQYEMRSLNFTGQISDFSLLSETFTKKVLAYKAKSNTVKHLLSAPIVETEGLKRHEISLLVLIMENQLTSEESYSLYNLKSEMSKAGFTDIATSVGIN